MSENKTEFRFKSFVANDALPDKKITDYLNESADEGWLLVDQKTTSGDDSGNLMWQVAIIHKRKKKEETETKTSDALTY